MRPALVALALVLSSASVAAAAQSENEQAAAAAIPAPAFDNGFAALRDTLGEVMGEPLSHELPGDEPGSVIQLTTTGLAYWRFGQAPAFTNGWQRWALSDGTVLPLVEWEGEQTDAPPPPLLLPGPQSLPNVSMSYQQYADVIGGGDAYCIHRIVDLETGFTWNPAAYNPQGWPPPYFNDHAGGLGGFLYQTWNRGADRFGRPTGPAKALGFGPNDYYDGHKAIRGIKWMLDQGYGGEFAAFAWGRCGRR
jgi:hypothetical protein